MSASTGVWHWIERFSWLAGIAALVIVLFQVSTDSDRRLKDFSESFNKRLDVVFEKLGERTNAYDDLKNKLAKLDQDHQILSRQYAAETARRKLEEIAARPNTPPAVKSSTASLLGTLDSTRSSLMNAGSTQPKSDPSLQKSLDALKQASKAHLALFPKSDKESLEPLLNRSWSSLGQTTFKEFPTIDRSLLQLQSPAPKTTWETLVDFVKKVPIAFVFLILFILGKLFK
jgi:hypothetical protein